MRDFNAEKQIVNGIIWGSYTRYFDHILAIPRVADRNLSLTAEGGAPWRAM
jgi:hypothetical protein